MKKIKFKEVSVCDLRNVADLLIRKYNASISADYLKDFETAMNYYATKETIQILIVRLRSKLEFETRKYITISFSLNEIKVIYEVCMYHLTVDTRLSAQRVIDRIHQSLINLT